MNKTERTVSSNLVTTYVPNLSWNQWIREPDPKMKNPENPKDKKWKDPGEPRPEAERVKAEINWPTLEQANLLADAGSSNAIAFAFTKRHVGKISNFPNVGDETTGAALVSQSSRYARKAWQLAVNLGSHIFAESFLSEGEEKN